MPDMRSQPETSADVLEFYRKLPFNVTGDPQSMAREILGFNSVSEYPPLTRLLNPRARTLDVGCGGGWLSNSIAHHYKSPVTGIDFNPVAIGFAKAVSAALGSGATFENVNLFTFIPERPFDVVVSIGVLHHTGDCMGALRHICRHTVRAGGLVFVGLYHLFGRKPFLEHFADMKARGVNEATTLAEFSRLIGEQPIDQTHLVSWFRDQVQHPYETQHTLAECIDVLHSEGMELIINSIDDYKGKGDPADAISKEAALEEEGRQRLLEGRYYPGFFCFLARRKK